MLARAAHLARLEPSLKSRDDDNSQLIAWKTLIVHLQDLYEPENSCDTDFEHAFGHTFESISKSIVSSVKAGEAATFSRRNAYAGRGDMHASVGFGAVGSIGCVQR